MRFEFQFLGSFCEDKFRDPGLKCPVAFKMALWPKLASKVCLFVVSSLRMTAKKKIEKRAIFLALFLQKLKITSKCIPFLASKNVLFFWGREYLKIMSGVNLKFKIWHQFWLQDWTNVSQKNAAFFQNFWFRHSKFETRSWHEPNKWLETKSCLSTKPNLHCSFRCWVPEFGFKKVPHFWIHVIWLGLNPKPWQA